MMALDGERRLCSAIIPVELLFKRDFREFFVLKDQCKFNNCLHVDEPKCAIKAAVESGDIAPSRYKSYLQMLEDESTNYRTDVAT